MSSIEARGVQTPRGPTSYISAIEHMVDQAAILLRALPTLFALPLPFSGRGGDPACVNGVGDLAQGLGPSGLCATDGGRDLLSQGVGVGVGDLGGVGLGRRTSPVRRPGQSLGPAPSEQRHAAPSRDPRLIDEGFDEVVSSNGPQDGDRIPVVDVADDASRPKPDHGDVSLLERRAGGHASPEAGELDDDDLRIAGFVDPGVGDVLKLDFARVRLQVARDCRAALGATFRGNREGKFHDAILGEHLYEGPSARIEALAEDLAQQARKGFYCIGHGGCPSYKMASISRTHLPLSMFSPRWIGRVPFRVPENSYAVSNQRTAADVYNAEFPRLIMRQIDRELTASRAANPLTPFYRLLVTNERGESVYSATLTYTGLILRR